jgi:NAD-dependent dihydropyrimidine dehydrogenase PreA subunit
MIALNQETCIGCGICEKICPHRVVELHDNKAYLAFEERCIECGACQLNCASDAIKVTKGAGCLFIIIKEDILKLEPRTCGYGS